MANTDMTFDEMLDTVNGFDELGIKQTTGSTLVGLLTDDPIRATRCLIAVHSMREAKQDGPKALKAKLDEAMALPFKDVRTYFAEPVEEFDASNPDSASGKGD
jgi:hypothetical protein